MQCFLCLFVYLSICLLLLMCEPRGIAQHAIDIRSRMMGV